MTLLYTSIVRPTYPLVIDTSVFNIGSTIDDVVLSGGCQLTQELTAQVRWLASDHIGMPRMIVDQTGSLQGISRHDYLPFGEEIGEG